MGVYSAMAGAGGESGSSRRDLTTCSWRWIFFVNVPIGALGLVLAPLALKESRDPPGRSTSPGMTVTAGMISLVYGVTNAASHACGGSGETVCPLAAAAGAPFIALSSPYSPRP